ncbi:hypothetical protein [Microvirga alba]|uniref:Uncharacterized protein n=1 Tax=Microvirga alba TaxID=2791025 RepID=A0A931FT81_9HYPH|nr:hypothetical protein [Microvirga alba]MBF9234441.1 hypothetical protein [Microvirga alba]
MTGINGIIRNDALPNRSHRGSWTKCFSCNCVEPCETAAQKARIGIDPISIVQYNHNTSPLSYQGQWPKFEVLRLEHTIGILFRVPSMGPVDQFGLCNHSLDRWLVGTKDGICQFSENPVDLRDALPIPEYVMKYVVLLAVGQGHLPND